MTELVTMGLNLPWMSFLQDELKAGMEELGGSFTGDVGEITEKYKPQAFLSSASTKKVALVTHPGMGELAEYLIENGVSVLNGGKLADAAHFNPEFVTIQAAKHRLLVSGNPRTFSKGYVLVATGRGIIDQWMEYIPHAGLVRGLAPSEEGITLRKSEVFDDSVTRKIEAMAQGWGYCGFLFVTGNEEDGQFWVDSISPFGPQAFWPALCRAFEGNLLKFVLKIEKSRHKIKEFSLIPTTVLKLSLPPYPYHVTPWVDNEAERRLVENWLRIGSVGIQLTPPENESSVVWRDVNKELLTTGPEVAYACVLEGDIAEVGNIAKQIGGDTPLQYKGVLEC